jgi:arabinan endo-1,5-alpha-L-arabinosidase
MAVARFGPSHLRVRRRLAAGAALVLALSALIVVGVSPAAAQTRTYKNPLRPVTPSGATVESCADPTADYGHKGEGRWFMYCTMDPLNDEDKTGNDFNFHLIPQFSSSDLVHWRYEGDALRARPSYATGTAALFAPEIEFYAETGEYHLYYTVTDTTFPGGGSAIGVATSTSALGPWTDSGRPVIEPHAADCCPGSRRAVFDPEVIRTSGPDYIYYGSYFGGVSVRTLSEDGMTSTPIDDGNPITGTKNVGIANKFEGPEVIHRGGWWYLFVSATDCCRGPLTGYTVMVGRSHSPTGPFLDKHGIDLNDDENPEDPTDGRAGGTPVIYQNGNRWIGTGHNTVLKDFDGQWWTIYHAVNVNDPYFAGAPGFTKRPPLLDAIDWVNGWPTLNGGRGPSDTRQPAPAAQPGQTTNHHLRLAKPDRPRAKVRSASDGFNGTTLSDRWTWVREPSASTFSVSGGQFHFQVQHADLHEDPNTASVLVERAPKGNYVVETKMRINAPPEGCCFNFVQAGLVIYGDDDNFIKLADVSIFNTRQTEFAKEVGPVVPAGFPRYGNTVVGPPGDWSAPPGWTYLRIVKRIRPAHSPTGLYGGKEHYTAYTSRDGVHWDRGGTWTHHLGSHARIGLIAMGAVRPEDLGPPPGAIFTADFAYVRVSRVSH